jgi:hypothetical protein
MANEAKVFELDYYGNKISVQQHFLAGTSIYRVQFRDQRSPLVITRAINANAARWWTSVPEGRQREAEEIGPLIAEYIRKNQG